MSNIIAPDGIEVAEKRPVKVAICVPVTDFCPPFWAFDLFRMGVYNGVQGLKMGIFFSNGSLIPKQRESLLDTALSDPAFTHILWLDSDMRFPPDLLVRLLQHDQGIVCASYTERGHPHRPVAFPDPQDFTQRLYTTEDKHGLEEIYACGFGCVLMRREIAEQMTKPRFMVGYAPSSGAHVGEDMYFFHKMHQEVGAPLYLDHDLTRDLSHIGRMEYTLNHALLMEAQRQATQDQEQENASLLVVPGA